MACPDTQWHSALVQGHTVWGGLWEVREGFLYPYVPRTLGGCCGLLGPSLICFLGTFIFRGTKNPAFLLPAPLTPHWLGMWEGRAALAEAMSRIIVQTRWVHQSSEYILSPAPSPWVCEPICSWANVLRLPRLRLQLACQEAVL